MIALDSKAQLGKSPKAVHVEVEEDSGNEEQNSEIESENGTMESEELESADENVRDAEDESTDAKDESDDNESQSSKSGNPGWADAMQKILRTKKPKRKKSLVLSKAKKLCDIKHEKAEDLPFEIDRVKDEVKVEGEEEEEKPNIKDQPLLKHRRKDNLGIRVKPHISERERERMLQKIATKGVLQLFNAVREQQTEIKKQLTKAGPLERKREKVLQSIDKRAFLDVLMGESKSIQLDNDVKPESEKETASEVKEDNVWSVLRDDFVMGAKLKDWDKKDDEEESSAPEDMDSDN